MRTLFLYLIFLWMSFSVSAQSNSIYDYSFIDINGDTISLSQFKGKKILFVNVASQCVYTKQYAQLQELHEKYKENLVIIGFPCNQFLKQEKGSEDEIKGFCKRNYGVEFLMASKINVKGKNIHPIYKWLRKKKYNGVKNSRVGWNFNKFLVDENGNWIAHFKSKVLPTDERITQLLK